MASEVILVFQAKTKWIVLFGCRIDAFILKVRDISNKKTNVRLYNFRLRFSEALGENAIPMMFVKLLFDQYDMQVMESVADFLELHYTEDDIGYVLKLPFCTNSEGLKFPNNFPMVCW